MGMTGLRRGEPLREDVEELLAAGRVEDVYDLLATQAARDAVVDRCLAVLESRLLGKYMRAARPNAVAHVVAAPDDFVWLTVDDEDRELIAGVDGVSTFEMLARSSPCGRFAAYRSLHRLVRARVLAPSTPTSDRTALLPARCSAGPETAVARPRPRGVAAILLVAVAIGRAAVDAVCRWMPIARRTVAPTIPAARARTREAPGLWLRRSRGPAGSQRASAPRALPHQARAPRSQS